MLLYCNCNIRFALSINLLQNVRTWIPHLPFSSKNDLKNSFWKNFHFKRVAVWLHVNQMIIHFSEESILPSVHYSIHPFLSNHPGAKSLVRHGIELLSLLFVSSSTVVYACPRPSRLRHQIFLCMISLQKRTFTNGQLKSSS